MPGPRTDGRGLLLAPALVVVAAGVGIWLLRDAADAALTDARAHGDGAQTERSPSKRRPG